MPELSTFNTVLLVGGAVVAVSVLLKVANRILKFVLTLAVIALVIYFWRGGTTAKLTDKALDALIAPRSVAGLLTDNCGGDRDTTARCICLIRPVYEDLTSRYDAAEIARIDSDAAQVRQALRESLRRQRGQIQQCLARTQGPRYQEQFRQAWEQVRQGLEAAQP
ncbi:MAG: hypothetical protein OHK0039_34600 [Bacteroidia bacterium]